MSHVADHTLFLARPVSTPLGRIVLAGTCRGEGLERERWRVYRGWALMCVTGGVGLYRDGDGHERDLQPGSVVTVWPGRAHWYGTHPGDTWDETYVVFDGPTFDLWHRVGLLARDQPVAELPGGPDSWAGSLRRGAASLEAATSPEARTVAFMDLLDTIAEPLLPNTCVTRGDPQAPRWLTAAERLLSANLGNDVDPRFVAGRLGISYETFRKSFTAATGVPPVRYRTARRVEAAAELMRFSPEVTNAELARAFGFADEFHFSKRFRAVTGRSPRQWRRQAEPWSTASVVVPGGGGVSS